MSITSKRVLKTISAVAGVAIALSLVLVAVAPVQAETMSAAQIQQAINDLNARLSSLSGTPSTASYTFNTNLSQGMRNADVMNLQKVLNSDADTVVSTSGVGSSGNETTYFGAATKAAVIKFQAKHGISPKSGFVGALTRGVLNGLGGVPVNPGTPSTVNPSGAGLMVSAGTQPINSLAPSLASKVPFTKFTLTAGNQDVTVSGVLVQRTGLGTDSNFSGVVLLDENGMQIGIAKTLNSIHQTTVGEPFTVKAGSSRTLTIAGNMANSTNTGTNGQIVSLAVVGVNTSAVVSGLSSPIVGASHTINSTLTLGTLTAIRSSYDPATAASKEIGTTGYKFSGVRVTAGSAEKVILKGIRWNQSGSVSSNDLANITTYVDGVAYPAVVSTDGKYYTSVFGNGITIDKGISSDIWVAGDIIGTGASQRNVRFDIYKDTDLTAFGDTYGYGITATGSGLGFSTTPYYTGSVVTVISGSATTIGKSASVPAQFVAVNVPNQTLGGFVTEMKGEPVSVQQMVFGLSAANSLGYITNVSLVDSSGKVVAGPVDAVANGSVQKVTFTDTVTLPVGQMVYTLKGKIPTGFTNGTVVTASTSPATGWTNITGQTTGNTITFSVSDFSMNSVTVKAAQLGVTISTTPTAQSIVSGGQGVVFANYQFDATQSGEDVRFANVQLTLSSSASTPEKLTSCFLYDGSTRLNSSSVAGSATPTFTFDSTLNIAKGTVKTLALKCNVDSTATGNYRWGITTSSSNPSVTGVVSGSTVVATPLATPIYGQYLTIGSSGTLAASVTGTGLPSNIVAAGTTGNVLGTINLHTENEAVDLNKLGLTLSGGLGNVVQASLWNGSTQVGTVNFTSATATSTFSTPIRIEKSTDLTLTVKADLGSIGTGQAGTPGATVAINYNSAQGTGVSSGSTIEGSFSGPTLPGVQIQKSYPIIEYSTANGSLSPNSNDLLVVKVTANASGPVRLYRLTFSLSTTTSTVSTFTFKGSGGDVGASAPSMNAAGTAVTVTFDSSTNTTDRVVTTSQPKYYTLAGTNVVMLGTSNGSLPTPAIAVALKADTTSTTTQAVAGLVASNIVWSALSTSTDSVLTTSYLDWTNGYGLPGCFTSIGSDCAARTIK